MLSAPPLLMAAIKWLVPYFGFLPVGLRTTSGWTAPWWLWVVAYLVCFSLAQFFAWKDEHQRSMSHTYPCPVLRFSEVEQRKPEFIDGVEHRYFRESELLVINETPHGAYEVRLIPTAVGKFNMHSWTQVDVLKESSGRLPYRVADERTHYLPLQYEHNLRVLLDMAFRRPGHGDELLVVPIGITYKDGSGNSFEARFELLYHPDSAGMPRIDIVSGPQRIGQNAKRREDPRTLGLGITKYV